MRNWRGADVTLDTKLFLAGLIAEIVVVILCLFRRIYRSLPVFSAYLIWSLLADAGEYLLVRHFPPTAHNAHPDLLIYAFAAIIDAVFMFGVLLELSMSVLRPIRTALPRWVMPVIGFLIIGISAAIWPFAKSPGFDNLILASQIQIHLGLTLSVLRILFFLALAGFSQLLSIGWRDRELQIATGFGIYSLAALSASLLHTSQTVGSVALNTQFHILDQMASATYICSMIYWCVSFAQEVPERREFTPQMQNFLLAMAGSARSSRIALTHTSESKAEQSGKR
jgi:hypothetical protein